MGKKRRRLEGGYNWHHRKPKKLGGSGNIYGPNMVEVSIEKHRAWHMLFDIKTPQQIAETINATWLDPDWEMVARRKGDATTT